MITEICPNIFRVKVPIEDSPLKDVNVYVLKTDRRNLVIDTGFNNAICLRTIQKAQRELELDWSRTDLFITHLHLDHFGLVGRLATRNTRIFLNCLEAGWFSSCEGFDRNVRYVVGHGFPADMIPGIRHAYKAIGNPSQWIRDARAVEDGARIDLGVFRISCIHTPGHTRGHMCLYEPRNRLLFSGDHILGDISPIIMCFSDEVNPLEQYLNSLKKTRSLDIKLVCPGHRGIIDDHRKAIDTIYSHHQKRLREVLGLLSHTPESAYNIAARMRWAVPDGDWHRLDDLQKWFATSEAVAHIRFLEDAGEVRRHIVNNKIYFRSK